MSSRVYRRCCPGTCWLGPSPYRWCHVRRVVTATPNRRATAPAVSESSTTGPLRWVDGFEGGRARVPVGGELLGDAVQPRGEPARLGGDLPFQVGDRHPAKLGDLVGIGSR